MCCCASRRGFIASPCRRCASRNSSANVCFCEGRSQKSTNRHPATPASLNSNIPPTNWNFDMLDFPRTALRAGGDPYAVSLRCGVAGERSPQRGRAGLGDLLVLVRGDAGHADRTHAFVARHDRHRALDQQASREVGEGGTLLDAVLEELAGPPG